MPRVKKATPRAGRTDKISISIDREDLALLRKRAKRLYGGNISAVVAEGVKHVRLEEGRQALLAWLGDAGKGTEEEYEAIRAEWTREPAPTKRRRRSAA